MKFKDRICGHCGVVFTPKSSRSKFCGQACRKENKKAYDRRYLEANRERTRENKNRWRAANPEKARECQRRYYEANADEIAKRQRSYREANPEKAKERQRRYSEANKERIDEYQRGYRASNRQKVRERAKLWARESRAADPEKYRAYRAANKEKVNASNRRWARANREKTRELGRRRYERLGGSSKHRRQWPFLLKRDGPKCGICGGELEPQTGNPPYVFHVDHIVPVAHGGKDNPENLQLAHPTCNLRKNDRIDGE